MPAGKGSGHTSRRAPAARPPAVPTMEISLVRALVALLTERSVSRAAESLNQAQPQMSATLKRLRELVHDPILVRGARGMVVTEHALTLLEPARRILGDMQLLMSESPRFDPLEVRRTLRLAIPDYISATLLGAILAVLLFGADAPAAFAQTMPDGAHKDLWCGTAFKLFLAMPDNSAAAADPSTARFLEGADKLIERSGAAMLAAGFAQDAVDKTKADFFDPRVSEAAFSLAQGAVSDPIQGSLTISLLKVVSVTPEVQRTLDEVKAELSGRLKLDKAK